MVITDEIKAAAQALGEALRMDDTLRPYRNAIEEFQSNPEAIELEKQLLSLYEKLIARQQGGEHLSHEEMQAFAELRRKVQIHPVISKRDDELRLLKPFLADIADEISLHLGVDFTALARPD